MVERIQLPSTGLTVGKMEDIAFDVYLILC